MQLSASVSWTDYVCCAEAGVSLTQCHSYAVTCPCAMQILPSNQAGHERLHTGIVNGGCTPVRVLLQLSLAAACQQCLRQLQLHGRLHAPGGAAQHHGQLLFQGGKCLCRRTRAQLRTGRCHGCTGLRRLIRPGQISASQADGDGSTIHMKDDSMRTLRIS
jgi:hypothetical protein